MALRAIVVGVGGVGRTAARLLLDRGVEIVGAVGRTTHVGEDIGEVLGRSPLGVIVTADADAVIRPQAADVIFHAATEDLSGILSLVERAGAAGIPIVSANETLLYPWDVEPELAQAIDRAARAHGIRVTASGAQDALWLAPALMLSGSSAEITAVRGVMKVDGLVFPEPVAYLGLGLDEAPGVDQDEIDFHVRSSAPACGAIASALGLHVIDTEVDAETVFAAEDLDCEPLGRPVRAGQVAGHRVTVTVRTSEGVPVAFTSSFQLIGSDDVEGTTWTIEGTPDLAVAVPALTEETVPAAIIHRIPDVLVGEPGLWTVDRLPALRGRRVLDPR